MTERAAFFTGGATGGERERGRKPQLVLSPTEVRWRLKHFFIWNRSVHMHYMTLTFVRRTCWTTYERGEEAFLGGGPCFEPSINPAARGASKPLFWLDQRMVRIRRACMHVKGLMRRRKHVRSGFWDGAGGLAPLKSYTDMRRTRRRTRHCCFTILSSLARQSSRVC